MGSFTFVKLKFSCLAVLLLPTLTLSDPSWISPPDTEEQIRSYGYPAESHYATTEDGYILKLFRIPSGKQRAATNKPLLLVHGLLCSSDCWTLNGADQGLAFILADNGYDVWIANLRGNTYSMSHKTLAQDDPKFWEFSFHEMGYYDLPAMIDLIIKETGETSVSYIGHSQGTTVFFVMASMRPEYQDKINVATHLAPVAFLDGARGTVKLLSAVSSVLVWLTKATNTHHLLHSSILLRGVGVVLCDGNPMLASLCQNIIYSVSDSPSILLNMTVFGQLVRYCPAGVSVKQLEHFNQLTMSGRFALFDYGPVSNAIKYRALTPPNYPLEKIKTPMYLFYSKSDNIATVPEVESLLAELSTVEGHFLVPNDMFSHIDYMWASTAPSLVYGNLISEMVKYR